MFELDEHIRTLSPLAITGKIDRLIGTTAAVLGLPVPLGATCLIRRENDVPLKAEVIGFNGTQTLLAAFGSWGGVRRGNAVELLESTASLKVGRGLLGRVINASGAIIDDLPLPRLTDRVRLHSPPLTSFLRPRITEVLSTGVRAIDGLLTCGRGQRMGLFAGSGVGKSTLLGQMLRGSAADVNVIILVGERGREVRDFIERDLGPEGLQKSVVIVATSDEAAILRSRAAFLGTAIAEYFRDQGLNVLLVMDSLTRFALAHRELGLAAGEPPATRGFPPSVFAILPKLLERAGRTERGSITAFYSVLVEGDDLNEPITDAVRGILDGHIVLTRELAEVGHYPAINILSSLSRLQPDVTDRSHQELAMRFRKILAARHQKRDLISLGAYQTGTDARTDWSLLHDPQIASFLTQPCSETVDFADTCQRLQQLLQSAPP